MNKLHFFYPENDLALASGLSNYTPPAPARALGEAGRALPLWYGNAGDQALCPGGVNKQWYDTVREKFGLETALFDYQSSLVPAPWGWSFPSRDVFAQAGYSAQQLPTDECLQEIRELSHRRNVIPIAKELADTAFHFSRDVPIEARTLGEAEVAFERYQGNVVVKSPWSSSGRGVADARACGVEKAMARVRDSIRKQGSCMIERAYDRVFDFALLFERENGECKFAGTSVFLTDAYGHYQGNVLAPENERYARVIGAMQRLAGYNPKDAETAIAILKERLMRYLGGGVSCSLPQNPAVSQDSGFLDPIGVDMILARDGTLAIAEINMRITMGHVANRLFSLHVAPGSRGVFHIEPCKGVCSESAGIEHAQVEGGRILKGDINLVPPNGHFQFMASIVPAGEVSEVRGIDA